MPFYTKHFQIPFFSRGESYSASIDQSRFRNIDEELNAISSIVGSGVVNGLQVSLVDSEKIKVSSGIFAINGKIYNKTIDEYFSIDNNSKSYVYVNSGSSQSVFVLRKSNISSIEYIDSGAGDPPSSVSFESISPYAVKIVFDSEIPADYKKIYIYRSLQNDVSSSDEIGVVNSPSLYYEDHEVLSGRTYYYWFKIEDINGFVSDSSESFVYQSIEDMSAPSPPLNLKTYPAHRSICVNWDSAISRNISHYILSYSQNDINESFYINSNVNHFVISGLKNGTPVSVSLKSVSFSEIESSDVSISSVPTFHPGARDADYIFGYFVSGEEASGASAIKIVWNEPEIDPNLPDLSVGESEELSGNYNVIIKYAIWELRQNGSIAIQGLPVTAFNNQQIIIRNFQRSTAQGQTITESLKDSSNYLIKLYRIVNGRESVGRFLKIKTGDVTPPSAATNISGELLNDGSLNFSWVNEKPVDVFKQTLSIKRSYIQSTTFDYSSTTEILFKIQNRISGNTSGSAAPILNELFGSGSPGFPLKIGFSSGYFIFEIIDRVIDEISSYAESSGIGLIESFKVNIPVGGLYVPTAGLNMYQLVNKLSQMPSIFEITWNSSLNNSLLSKTYQIKILDLISFYNVNGLSDNDIYFTSLINQEPISPLPDISYDGAPDSVPFRTLSDGLSYDDIPRYVSLSSPQIVIKETIGNVYFYNLSSKLVEPSARYFITITSYDFSENASQQSSFYFDTPDVWQILPPSPPSNQTVFIEDDMLVVAWSPVNDTSVSGYRILRAEIEDSESFSSSENSELTWQDVAIVQKNEYQYSDYSAEYGKYYVYRIVSIGLLGKISPSFFGLDPNEQTTPIVFFRLPEDTNEISILLEKEENDVKVIISNRGDNHDGYVIMRRFNKGSFYQVGSISSSEAFFIDKGALIFSGLYEYVVFPIASESYVSIVSYENEEFGILLAEVVRQNDEILINDMSSSSFLLGSLMKEEMGQKISSHRHLLYDDNYDLRVSLSNEYKLSNFITDNNQRFLINEDLPNLPENYSFMVMLNGSLSSIPFEFIPERKLLKFAVKLAPLDGEIKTSEPFVSLPDILLLIDTGGETSGSLSANKFGEFFGQQIGSGRIESSAMPILAHSGYSGSIAKPLDCICESVDGFKFLISLNENRNYLIFNRSSNSYSEVSEYSYNGSVAAGIDSEKVGFPLNKTRNYIIYDSFNIPGTENFVFATNFGVYHYYQQGDSFNIESIISYEAPSDSGPCHKLIFMPASRSLLCINFRSFDILSVSESGVVSVIQSQLGLDYNCHVFRDAVEMQDGSFFISSDIGLFRVQFASSIYFSNYSSYDFGQSNFTSNIKMTQLGFFSGRSTDIYSVWSNSEKDKLYVSTEFGIFYSENYGQTFSKDENLKNIPRLWSVINYQNVWFGIGDNAIYRKRLDEDSFVQIYYNDNLFFRNMKIKYGRIIVCTNDGVYHTDSILYAKYNSSISVSPINIDVAESGKRRFVYSLSDFGPYMICSMEGKTKIAYSLERFADHVDFTRYVQVIAYDDFPTVYINDIQVNIGVYFQYNQNPQANDCIFFDFFVPETQSVKVVRQYVNFVNSEGGWASRDFAASAFLYKNNIKINDGSRANKPFNQIAYYSDVSHSLDDTVSSLASLDSRIIDLKDHSLFMLINKVNQDGNPIEYGIHRFTRNNIRKLIDKIDLVNSSIYSDDEAANLGILSSIRVQYPFMEVNFVANVIPQPYGVSLQKLSDLGISYASYEEPSFEGTLGTYDPEDPPYYMPPLPTRSQYEGVESPNYVYIDEDEDVVSAPDVPYSGFYGENNGQPNLVAFGGRRVLPDGSVELNEPPAFLGGPGSGEGGGVGAGGT